MSGQVDVRRARAPSAMKVKNKMPAEQQITAEQILREAKEREFEKRPPPPTQKISDPEELAMVHGKKRKDFEDNLRKNRSNLGHWMRYGAWEEQQNEIARARSVFERARDVFPRSVQLWLRYIDMEMRLKQVNHARNIFDRAVGILPRANQLWYKYVFMEEMLENVAGCRQVFERWMKWHPPEQAWHAFINFELRYHELDRARDIYERFVISHPDVKNWLKFAKFEEKNGFINGCRRVYERAIEFFGDEQLEPDLFASFAQFEERRKEYDRARVIFRYALDRLPREQCQQLLALFASLENRVGDRGSVEDVVIAKRVNVYEKKVTDDARDYDAWFDYTRLAESEFDELGTIREVYERAIANVPLSDEKRHWRRYMYLWLNYAVFEELVACDVERTRQIYKTALQVVPHKLFTFAKLWTMYAHFELRQLDVKTARRVFGTAIGMCPKQKLFKNYIETEIRLRQFDRVRTLYEKFLEYDPENVTTWMKYAELETFLFDYDRARAIFDLAVSQPRLDLPELLWKAYIDFEINAGEHARARDLFRRLLQQTQHIKVWLALVEFEKSLVGVEGSGEDAVKRCRDVYERADDMLRQQALTGGPFERDQRAQLLQKWLQFEMENKDKYDTSDKIIGKVQAKQPQKVKRRRQIVIDRDGIGGGRIDENEDSKLTEYEEYEDWVFPDHVDTKPHIKLLELAKKFKMNKKLPDELLKPSKEQEAHLGEGADIILSSSEQHAEVKAEHLDINEIDLDADEMGYSDSDTDADELPDHIVKHNVDTGRLSRSSSSSDDNSDDDKSRDGEISLQSESEDEPAASGGINYTIVKPPSPIPAVQPIRQEVPKEEPSSSAAKSTSPRMKSVVKKPDKPFMRSTAPVVRSSVVIPSKVVVSKVKKHSAVPRNDSTDDEERDALAKVAASLARKLPARVSPRSTKSRMRRPASSSNTSSSSSSSSDSSSNSSSSSSSDSD